MSPGPGAAAFALAALLASPASAATVRVRVEGLRSRRGLVRVALFSAARGFPERFELAGHTASAAPAEGSVEVVLEGVEPGLWAVAVLHDENGNQQLDRNLLGIPTEGVGASNDAARRGSPSFEDARVRVSEPGLEVQVPVHYWLR